jgi:hypothetical protein
MSTYVNIMSQGETRPLFSEVGDGEGTESNSVSMRSTGVTANGATYGGLQHLSLSSIFFLDLENT